MLEKLLFIKFILAEIIINEFQKEISDNDTVEAESSHSNSELEFTFVFYKIIYIIF